MDSGQQECRKDGLKGEAVILASPAQRPSWLLYGLLTYRDVGNVDLWRL